MPQLSAIRFKILLDTMTTSRRPLLFAALGYQFRTCEAGRASSITSWRWNLIALYDRMFGRLAPVRFAMFAGIGLIGALVHFLVLAPLPHDTRYAFRVATVTATSWR